MCVEKGQSSIRRGSGFVLARNTILNYFCWCSIYAKGNYLNIKFMNKDHVYGFDSFSTFINYVVFGSPRMSAINKCTISTYIIGYIYSITVNKNKLLKINHLLLSVHDIKIQGVKPYSFVFHCMHRRPHCRKLSTVLESSYELECHRTYQVWITINTRSLVMSNSWSIIQL